MHQTNLPWEGNVPTPLDPVETVVDPSCSPLGPEDAPIRLRPVETFRHSGWKADRERVYDALLAVNTSYSRRESFRVCGSGHWVLRRTDDRTAFRVVPDHCHDRFCVPCGGQRQAVIRANLARRLQDHPHRFLTLTVRSNGEPLSDLIKHLYDSFRRLRARAFWKRHVTGGCAFLELTYSEQRRSWHPHLHAMLEGRYVDLQDLKRTWLGVTGDSHAIHIRIVRRKPDVVNYITKYATKPLPPEVLRRPDCLEEAIQTLQGTRMVLCFGTWRNWKLLEDVAEVGWELFGHLNSVKCQALDGNTLCQNILDMMPTADPDTGEFTVIDDGPAPDD